eukprot:TRINITY_DN14213_c0_g1_i14.p1 TRINITY_DN14213_c0_g1~~TRINITY_DN14213_c0_g1_i14.p1  ORF type:complete len:551 (-),score=149.05 TRINITY_DN14213_c0_g1_i14:47-1699(-)
MLSRKVCALIVCFLASVVPLPDYLRIYFPILKKQAEDSNWELRQVIAKEIPNLCRTFKKSKGLEQLFSILLKLLEDIHSEVFAAAVESFETSIQHFADTDLFNKAVARLKKLLESPKPEVLRITLHNVGEVLVGISRKVLMKDRELFGLFKGISMSEVKKGDEESAVEVARNLPGIVSAYSPEIFCWEMFEILEQLMANENLAIMTRATFAKCFHELVKLFGFDLSMERLVNYFFKLLDDSEMFVIEALLENIETIFAILCSRPRQEKCQNFLARYFSLLPQVYQKAKAALLRSEAKFLSKLAVTLKHVNAHIMTNCLAPIFKEVLKSSPYECRMLVCGLLSAILGGVCQPPIRREVHSLCKGLGESGTHQNRISCLELLNGILGRMSVGYFKEHFLDVLLNLAQDKVVGVQLKFCFIALEVRKRLLPADTKTYHRLAFAIEGIMKKTKSRCLRETAAVALKKFETSEYGNASKENELVKAEKELFAQEEKLEKESKEQVKPIIQKAEAAKERKINTMPKPAKGAPQKKLEEKLKPKAAKAPPKLSPRKH